MKKILFSLLFMVGIIGTASADFDKVITFDQLPAAAQKFVTTYFANDEILLIQKESRMHPNYEVKFATGNEVDFNSKGEWIEVKNMNGVNNAIVPGQILSQVQNKYPNAKIIDIDRSDKAHIEIELDNKLDIKFSKKSYIIIDTDD
jgi:Protein of unknown function (DUF2874).